MKNQYSPLAKSYSYAIQDKLIQEKVGRIIKQTEISNNTKGILDIGCANGAYLKAIKKQFPKLHPIVGIDNTQELITLAKDNSEGLEFYLADMNKLPFENGSFEAVFSIHTIHYTNNLSKTLFEVARVTRSGGNFFFIVSHPIHGLFLKTSNDYEQKENTLFPAQWDKSIIIEHLTFSLSDYINSIVNNGWQIVNIFEDFGREATTFKPYRIPTNIQFTLRRLS